MYLFDLNMSHIKSEPLAQECFKSKVFLKISRTDLKTTVRGSLFYNKDAECIKLLRPSYTRYRYFPPSEICEIFNNTFENTINSVK